MDLYGNTVNIIHGRGHSDQIKIQPVRVCRYKVFGIQSGCQSNERELMDMLFCYHRTEYLPGC